MIQFSGIPSCLIAKIFWRHIIRKKYQDDLVISKSYIDNEILLIGWG